MPLPNDPSCGSRGAVTNLMQPYRQTGRHKIGKPSVTTPNEDLHFASAESLPDSDDISDGCLMSQGWLTDSGLRE